MSAPSPQASTRLRLVWLVRLMAIEFRGHRRAKIVAVCAFALATVAAVACLAGHSAWRMAGRSATGGAVGQALAGAELVAFLREDLPASLRNDLATALTRLPGVQRVRVLTSDEALSRLRSELGDRSSILDGVEEGFLPATLEVSLRPGPEGVGRADTIAWRLRRMEGITEVDVLRTIADQRLARAEGAGRRFGGFGLVLGAATALMALGLAAVALRSRRSDGRLLAGLGFTTGAIVLPGTLVGAACAGAGAVLGGLLVVGIESLGAEYGVDGFAVARGIGIAGWPPAVGGLAAAVVLGAGLAWWGAWRSVPPLDDLAGAD